MAIQKVPARAIDPSASSANLNIDAGTLYLDATNNRIGVATTSPATSAVTVNGTNDQVYLRTANTNASVLSIGYTAANSVYLQSKSTGTGTTMPIAFYINSTQAMTLDTNGNLGLGVIPTSAWGQGSYGFKAIDIGNYGALAGWSTDTRKFVGLYCNSYLNASSSFVYKSDGAASSYRQWQGTHEWTVAASGTAGNTFTPTTAMTLDNNSMLTLAGSLYLPTGNAIRKTFTDNTAEMLIDSAAHSSWGPYLSYTASAGTPNRGFVFGAWSNSGTQAEWMRIWDGKIGIGTGAYSSTVNNMLELRQDSNTAGDAPVVFLNNRGTRTTNTTPYYAGGIWGGGFRDVRDPGYIAGIDFYRQSASSGLNSAGEIRFYTVPDAETLASVRSSGERMRIKADGTAFFNTTSFVTGVGASQVNIVSNGNQGYFCLGVHQPQATNAYGIGISTMSGSNMYFYYNGSGSPSGSIGSGSSSTTYSTSSDIRLKTDLGVATQTNVIDATVIHDFEWKIDGSVDRGVFAQEAVNVIPKAVTVGNDDVTESGELQHPWGVDYSHYVPDLIVYCQQLKKTADEQQAIITQLTERIAALEAK